MLTEERIERYARHILLREVGGVGQSRLLDGRVQLRGLGTVGEWAAAYLALAGVGTLVLEDPRPLDSGDTGPLGGPAPEDAIPEGALTRGPGKPRPDGVPETGPTGAGGSRAEVLAGLLPAFNGDPHYEVVEGLPWDDPTLALTATLEDEKVLEVRLAGHRFLLDWKVPGGAAACGVCAQEWLGTGDPALAHAIAALAGSLAAGEILGKLLGIGSVPQGRRWFDGGLPVPAPVCSHR